jgi:hypothetical protein
MLERAIGDGENTLSVEHQYPDGSKIRLCKDEAARLLPSKGIRIPRSDSELCEVETR